MIEGFRRRGVLIVKLEVEIKSTSELESGKPEQDSASKLANILENG